MIVTPYSSLGLHATYAELCPSAVQLDRFIPSRSALDVDVSSYNLLKENAMVAEIPQKVCLLATEGKCSAMQFLRDVNGVHIRGAENFWLCRASMPSSWRRPLALGPQTHAF